MKRGTSWGIVIIAGSKSEAARYIGGTKWSEATNVKRDRPLCVLYVRHVCSVVYSLRSNIHSRVVTALSLRVY